MNTNTDPQVVITPREEYGELLALAFEMAGERAFDAARMAAGRFPLLAADLPTEAFGRGVEIDPDAPAAYLAARFGQPIDPDEIGWLAYLVDELLTWCVENGRGRAPAARTIRFPRTVAAMLAMLRSEDLPERMVGMAVLSRSLGAGLAVAGENPDDMEHLILPQLSALLGRAGAGDPDAVDELERHVTTNPAHAFRPGDRHPARAEHN